MDEIPHNNLLLVMPAIGLVLFLGALDQTIVATALPTIAQDLHATPSEYQWVGTAYTLSMTLMAPMNGRVSDIIGRKFMLYGAIIDFTLFSALCGAAKNMTWLIVARAFQGMGGGCIVGLTSIVTSDIIPLHQRGTYQGYLGGAWGVASVLGPILGGVLTQKASWYVFHYIYINLPTCAIAFALLVVTLKLNPVRRLTPTQFLNTFDFFGLGLVMAGAALLIVGFSTAADDGFKHPKAYAVIIVGGILFLSVIPNSLLTKRNAIIPARMFKNRTTLFFLIGSTLHSTAFLPANYLIPQLLQGVRGLDAIQSGVQLLPFAVLVAVNTIIAGQINSRLRIIRPVAWVGLGMASLAFGLLYKYLSYPIDFSTQEGLFALAGTGIGLSLQVPMLVLQAAMPLKEMAATTAAWTLTRSLGGSVGLAIFTAILNTGLRSRFETIPGYGTIFSVPQSSSGYRALHDLPEGEVRDRVLIAFADSLKLCWALNCAFFGAALLVCYF
ncbi:hypothetical protein TREMEDRAFT_67877 [Tremella mesenterica DSM 1558]|uniref:uncharacterized protein n=1 Tax=Tremella mesenterica (strain ATCC 24925 / CBS 8224 / DSM 1558 / NBRC 9311 / NRRL Y-6157 / RJB 2259-6 / UBC 559-6) TaxID=578456 RepID=UPI0003F4A390|nr:uncharacterized protein TREMEDRAFT_67877 [Tremella mesenterica DSM 1558]EIW71642.1 hypothetical protein TREMEDRAFT_67877 [Tremella mesenterica DSM 1558]